MINIVSITEIAPKFENKKDNKEDTNKSGSCSIRSRPASLHVLKIQIILFGETGTASKRDKFSKQPDTFL